MMSVEAQLGDQYISTGLAARSNGRLHEAGRYFQKALNEFARVPDPAQRRAVLGPAALAFESSGHHDLALAAVRDALVLDEQLHDHRHLAEDLLTQGNIQMQLGRVADAEKSYERALASSLAHGHLDNAASAGTNLAILLANSSRLAQAIAQLQQSLVYLQQQPHLPTEIHTRLALIQAVDAAGADAAIAVDAARGLFARPTASVDAPQWQAVEGAFRRCLGHYLAGRPELDAAAWKAETFPQLFSGA
jgi:tetratricopeptide (TPR) repeat protein